MALGMGEYLVIASGLLVLFTVAFMKDAKMKKYLSVGGIAGAFIGIAAFGAFGLTQAPPGEGPVAQGLWAVSILDTSDTDRAEASELISSDLHTVTYSLSDADIDDVGDVDLNLRILNINDALTTKIWIGEISLSSVGTVLVSGVATPIANYTTNLSRFAITFTKNTDNNDISQTNTITHFTTTTNNLKNIS